MKPIMFEPLLVKAFIGLLDSMENTILIFYITTIKYRKCGILL